MKPGTNGRRPRGRPNRKQHGGQSRPNNFDSNGPEGRVRGNAHQVYERYLAMARDAVSGGDRVAAETYFQHAEHYFRVLNSSTDPQQNGQTRPDRRGGDGRRDESRQDRARQAEDRPDSQPAIEAQNGSQPAVSAAPVAPVANGEDAPHRPAQPETRSRPQQRRAAAVAPEAESLKGNSAEPAPENADAQPNPRAGSGDCEPVNV